MATKKKTAFTWSPNPKKIENYINPMWTYQEHMLHLKKLKRCCSTIELYPEFNSNGKLHWHGELTITDKIKWYKQVLPYFQYKGFVCVKEVFTDKWATYMSKDKDMMEEILEIKLPITKSSFTTPKKKETYTDLYNKTVLDYLADGVATGGEKIISWPPASRRDPEGTRGGGH